MPPRVSKVDIAFVVIAAGNIAARSKAWDENDTRGNPKRVEVSSHSSTCSPKGKWTNRQPKLGTSTPPENIRAREQGTNTV